MVVDAESSMAITPRLSAEQARALTDEVREDAAALWAKLLTLYAGGAHLALGYRSWGAYFEQEFRQSARHGYRLLEAARVVGELEAGSSDQLVTEPYSGGPLPLNEGQARELAPLIGDPEQLAAAWEEARDRFGPEPTAAEVRAVVQAFRADDDGAGTQWDPERDVDDEEDGEEDDEEPSRTEEELAEAEGRLLRDDFIAALADAPRFGILCYPPARLLPLLTDPDQRSAVVQRLAAVRVWLSGWEDALGVP
jgi:hypothetical protein